MSAGLQLLQENLVTFCTIQRCELSSAHLLLKTRRTFSIYQQLHPGLFLGFGRHYCVRRGGRGDSVERLLLEEGKGTARGEVIGHGDQKRSSDVFACLAAIRPGLQSVRRNATIGWFYSEAHSYTNARRRRD
jgi:hypothetical protein